MKKRSIIPISFFCIIFLISFVSAGIYFSDLNSKYNLGDMIDFNVKVDPVKEGWLLNTKLYCNSNFVIEFNNLPDSGKINIKLPLNFNTINRANGNCYFTSFYGEESRNSIDFEISKLLIVKLSNDAFFAKPNEQIIVSGAVEKINGNPVNGEIEIKIPLLEILKSEVESSEVESNSSSNESESNNSVEKEIAGYNAGVFYGKVSDGKFSVSVKIPEDSPAGDFRIDILVYEKLGDEKTSEGLSYGNLKVFQVLRDIELNLNTQNFDPGTTLEIKPKLLDQTGVGMIQEVSVIIRNEQNERFYEKIVKSEGINYEIPKNTPSGYYNIEASAGEINISKGFFVNQKAISSFDLVNDTLVVTNVGNIPYHRDIEIELNGKPFVKKIDLELGESTSFKLTGSEGDYNVKVSDGVTELSKIGVSLTGKVVSVNNVKEELALTSPIFWIFFFVILIFILLFLFRSVFRKRSVAFHSLNSIERNNNTGFESKNEMKIKPLPVYAPEIKKTDAKGSILSNKADQVMVMNGDKSKVAVIAIKIRNKLGKSEKRALEQVMESVYIKKGAVYEQGDFIFTIFSPLMTKSVNNEQIAMNIANNICNALNDYNKKFKDVIEFGIAVNSGEIINKVENGKLKFTALGNSLIATRRLADSSNGQVLLSRNVFEKAGSQFKIDKQGDNYILRKIIDTEKNNKFIQGFLDRQKQ